MTSSNLPIDEKKNFGSILRSGLELRAQLFMTSQLTMDSLDARQASSDSGSKAAGTASACALTRARLDYPVPQLRTCCVALQSCKDWVTESRPVQTQGANSQDVGLHKILYISWPSIGRVNSLV